MKYNQYIHCPACESHYVNIDREVGDKGGTEALVIQCHDCKNENRVVL